MSTTEIEKRLKVVEQRLSHLAEKVETSSASQYINGWIDQIHGTFQNDASYRQAARVGRQWRKSQRSAPSRHHGYPHRRDCLDAQCSPPFAKSA